MNPYTLAAIIIVTIGVVISLLIYRSAKVAETATKEFADTARKPFEVIGTATSEAVDKVAAPIAGGVADICHAIAGRIETKREELHSLRTQTAALTQENERLRNQQIKVDQIKPIFQVAFFQSDLSETDFFKEVVEQTQGGMLDRHEAIEYLGVFHAKNTQKFGIDFEALKFRIVSSSVLQVSGFGKTKLIGNLNTDVKLGHKELRKHLTGGPRPDSHEILTGDIGTLMLDNVLKQQKRVQLQITQERKIDQVEQGIELMTMQFLKDFFSPRGYSVIKASEELTDGKSIFEIQEEINAQVAKRINDNDRQLADVGGKVEAREHDLKLEIQSLKEVDFPRMK